MSYINDVTMERDLETIMVMNLSHFTSTFFHMHHTVHSHTQKCTHTPTTHILMKAKAKCMELASRYEEALHQVVRSHMHMSVYTNPVNITQHHNLTIIHSLLLPYSSTKPLP